MKKSNWLEKESKKQQRAEARKMIEIPSKERLTFAQENAKKLLEQEAKKQEKPKEFDKLNGSGWRAPEYKIIIKPDEVDEKTKGGIILTSKVAEDEQNAKVEGVIVAFGAKAFDSQTWPDMPQIGDRVLIPSYAGIRLIPEQTQDGKLYRVILDREIIAIRENINQSMSK